MSFVTTPIRISSPRARQSAATSELLPEPTGPPMPSRSARSGGKEPALPGGVAERAELERGREPARQAARVVARRGGAGRELLHERRGLGDPARRLGRV